MGEIHDRLEPEELHKLADAAPAGRSASLMSSTELTEYAGAARRAFKLIDARIVALGGTPSYNVDAGLEANLLNKLTDAEALGRSKRHLTHSELTEFAGKLYLGYENLAARVGVLEAGTAGSYMENLLETADKAKLVEAGALGRSKVQMTAHELTEWAGATDAAYLALDVRVAILEGAT